MKKPGRWVVGIVAVAAGVPFAAASAAPVSPMTPIEVDTGTPGKTILATLTVVGPSEDGWAVAYPCSEGYSGTSNINYRAGADTANLVVVRADAAGKVCLLTQKRANLLFDQTAALASSVLPVSKATRLLDTRTTSKPQVGSVTSVRTGSAGRTIVGNLTVVAPESDGFLAAYPCATGATGTSSLNFSTGQTVANALFVKADGNGDVCVRTTSRTHIIFDRVGDTTTSAPGASRPVDTRRTARPAAGATTVVPIGAANTTVIGNLTIAGVSAPGFGVVYPCSQGAPETSNVNYSFGDVASLFVARTDGSGNLCVRTSTSAHVIVDEIGRAGFGVDKAVRKLDTRIPKPGDAPTVGGCQIFPSDNPWNTPIDTLPVRAESATWVNRIGRSKTLRFDFGGPYGMPFRIVPANEPLRPINFTAYGYESDPGPYPVPLNSPIEGGSNATGDRHVIVLQQGTCRLYEMYRAFPTQNGWNADSGAVFDLSSNALRPDRWTAADAAGLPIFAGLARMEDIEDGVIRHALRFTVSCTQKGYISPATHQAGQDDLSCPPMGARFRLKASFDVSGFTGKARLILDALKTYGMFVADNGGDWYITGAQDERWDWRNLEQLYRVTGDAFEVVDTGPIRR